MFLLLIIRTISNITHNSLNPYIFHATDGNYIIKYNGNIILIDTLSFFNVMIQC